MNGATATNQTGINVLYGQEGFCSSRRQTYFYHVFSLTTLLVLPFDLLTIIQTAKIITGVAAPIMIGTSRIPNIAFLGGPDQTKDLTS